MANPQPRRRWSRRTGLLVLLLVIVVGVNAVAFFQARLMTTFLDAGDPKRQIEELTWPQRAKALFVGARMERPQNRITPAQYEVSFLTDTVITQDHAQVEVWVVEHPSAYGVVCLFHGYRASKEDLIAEARSFHDLGYTTILVDFRGSGGSSGNATTIGYDEAYEVAAVARYAKERFPGACLILYGQSMGAAAVLREAAADSAVADVLIIEAVFDRLVTTVGHRFEAMGLPTFPLAHLLVFWGGVQRGFNGFAHDPLDYAKHVRIPTLIMHGEEDRRATISEARQVYEHLPGHKDFLGFPRVAHSSCHDADPMAWVQAVGRFTSEACDGRIGQ